MKKWTKEQTERWIERNFVVCKCGYRNEIKRFERYGVCLSCGRILDEIMYFKHQFYVTRQKVRRKDGKNNKRLTSISAR